MICGLEIAMLVMGILALVQGKVQLGQGYGLAGAPAYLAGVVMLLPIPAAFVFIVVLNANYASKGYAEIPPGDAWIPIAGEAAIAVLALLVVAGIAVACAGPLPTGPRRREDDDRDRDRDVAERWADRRSPRRAPADEEPRPRDDRLRGDEE